MVNNGLPFSPVSKVSPRGAETSAAGDLGAVLEQDHEVAVEQRLHFADLRDADDGGAGDAYEALRVEAFELLFNAGGRYQALGEWALHGTSPPTQRQPGLF